MATNRLFDTADTENEPVEETELTKKEAELAAVEELLFWKEAELDTLFARLQSFEKRYLRLLAAKYVELDELNAQIAEAEARLNPYDLLAQERARIFRNRANQNAQSAFA